MIRAVLPPILGALVLSGCGKYADFRLPGASSENGSVGGTWQWSARPAPVMARGASGQWDSVDTLNPSVVAGPQGKLFNFYSGYDGRVWHTGVATSPDGLVWSREARVLSPDATTWEGAYIAANGAALYWKGDWWYWYQAGSPPRIGLARSSDGRAFRKHPVPVVPLGPRGSWDERAAADPYVIEFQGKLYLYYLGEDRARRQRLGVAVSDDGINWTKHKKNPILELGGYGDFDENGLGEPAVWRSHGRWWMLYTGRAHDEVRRMGFAVSTDGVGWKRYPLIIEGDQGWNKKVVCDATVIVAGGKVRVWFGGGDVAHPAENVNGQIGYGELEYR